MMTPQVAGLLQVLEYEYTKWIALVATIIFGLYWVSNKMIASCDIADAWNTVVNIN